MNDEIKIPDDVFADAYNASTAADRQFSTFAQVIARWMREECAKVACCPGHAMAEAIHAAILKVGTK